MASGSNQHIFAGAQNPIIYGGTFTNVGGNMTVNPMERPGLKRLLENIAPGAFHDAVERGDPPKCHPRTRVAIRQEIMQWIKGPGARRQFITWLYGPAGSGKTAIAQSIAETCEEEGLLAASFFFGRLANGRNTSAHFVATIAYQLSRSIPEIEDRLLTVIEKDPSIFSRSLSTQMHMLIIEPLKSVPLHSISSSRLVVVDGVDECGPNGQAHTELLKVLGAPMAELKHIPIIFLISSRPEYEIRTAFNKKPLSLLTKSLGLDDQYEPDKDIKIYLKSKFREIQQDHLPLLCGQWPTECDVNLLVSKASGQFIFAATVIKFIDCPRNNPIQRLNIILGLVSVENEAPFALLDSLYRFILGSVADVQKVLDILTVLLLAENYENTITVVSIEELLGFDVRRALVDMHALMFVPPPTNEDDSPRIYHASLYDFLKDQSRSLDCYIDETRGHVNLSKCWLRIIGNCGQSRIDTWFAMERFVHHCDKLDRHANQEVLDELAHFDLRASLERISNFEEDLYDSDWGGLMNCIKKQGGSRSDVFPRLQNDFDSFILDRIGRYPQSLQPYIPTLLSGLRLTDDIFDVLLHGASKSTEEFNQLRDLDKRLLDIPSVDHHDWNAKSAIKELFKDKTRSGPRFVDGGSYAALAKAVVNVICALPGERNYQIRFEEIDDDGDRYTTNSSDPTMRIALVFPELRWFKKILHKASTDLDLAHTLLERAVQFRNDVEPILGRRNIAKASIKYIQRCGIPFLTHAHRSDANECGICMWCEGAIEVEDKLDIINDPLPSPLLTSETSAGGDEFHSVVSELPFFDSEFESRRDSAILSIHHNALNTPIPSSLCLPSISEWYQSTTLDPSTSTQQFTSRVSSLSECDAHRSAAIPVHHAASDFQISSSHPPLILQSKRKRADTLASSNQANLSERFDKGKRRRL